MKKFAHGHDDGLPYYRASGYLPHIISLEDQMRKQSDAQNKRRIKAIDTSEYLGKPYTSTGQFVKDIAAVACTHSNVMHRRTASKSTVLASLKYATASAEVQYLFNGPRYKSRNPDAKMMYGTTACEAVHAEIKAFFPRALVQQTARYAETMSRLFCVRKLLTGALQRQTWSSDRTLAFLLSLKRSAAASK